MNFHPQRRLLRPDLHPDPSAEVGACACGLQMNATADTIAALRAFDGAANRNSVNRPIIGQCVQLRAFALSAREPRWLCAGRFSMRIFRSPALVRRFTMATSHSPVDIDVSMPPPGLGDCMLREPGTGRKFPLSELWATQPCFIHFLRRFGCPLCQKGAQDLSQLKAELDRLNVRMVAIGFEDESYPQFAEGSFWAGDLFFDDNRQTYSLLGFKRQNAVKGFTSLFSASGAPPCTATLPLPRTHTASPVGQFGARIATLARQEFRAT